MKLKEIAARYRIDSNEFSDFLVNNRLRYTKGLLTGIVVADSDVEQYVSLFQDELKRRKEAEIRKRAEEEARKKAEAEEARKRAEEEAAKRVIFEEQRKERIAKAQAEFVDAEKRQEREIITLTESERRAFIMANSVKLCREKLTGTWVQAGASYADGDILGLWLRGFSYSGVDGDAQTATTGGTNKQFNYRVLVTGDESGKCYLYVSGNPNLFCSTLGEIAFSDDNNFFTLNCRNSSFLFARER